MPFFVAFLRGINVGGNKLIPMKSLAAIFAEAGFRNVSTVLASGNVVFESAKAPEAALAEKIESAIRKKFGFESVVQVRTLDDIKRLLKKNPFSGLTPDEHTHWYVTFLNRSGGKLPVPAGDAFRFLGVQDNVLFSLLDKRKGKSTDFMTFLDKTYGKQVTTRNWNTLLKIAGVVD